MKETTYRYRLKSTGAGSAKYGSCEVCGGQVSEMFYQSEECAYLRPDGTQGWTMHKCVGKFGHKECLLRIRREGNIDRD